MHKITFFPLGNADSYRVDLANGRKLLLDYAAKCDPDDPTDRRIDLPRVLRDDLQSANRDNFDVVAFTHLDDDHICGASEFFHLEHAKKYQGEGRIFIRELWVPAAVITEEGCADEAAVIQAEARHRLRAKSGIRVFSRPEALEDWLKTEGMSLSDVRHLITDAGKTVEGFRLDTDGVEFFVHSPFASRQDDGTLEDRNRASLVLQATFQVDGIHTRFVLCADATHEVLSEMVKTTRSHGNEERLEWDIFKLPHHCSYLSLGPEKGAVRTEPVPEVAWLFEEQGQAAAIVVSTSKPIPSDDSDDQPPHRQAANYYRECTDALGGEFKVTMEHPRPVAPEELVITIEGSGATIKKQYIGGAAAIVSRPAPRAG